MKRKIKYLKHKDINKSKWDDCIRKSYNHTIYALSWYLDSVSPKWHALVLNDYEAVMPLPVSRKFFMRIIYQPHFTQQLGIFSTFSLLNDDILLFFKSIPWKFISIKQNCNAKNDLYPLEKEYNLLEQSNILVNLYRPYNILNSDFDSETIENIKKAERYNFRLRYDTDLDVFLNLIYQANSNINSTVFNTFKTLLYRTKEEGQGECVGVFIEDRLIAATFILRSFNRFIYIASASNKEGKEKCAMFYLINEFFKMHCQQKHFFDFEESITPDLADLYNGFGGNPEYYNFFSYNRIKDPIKKVLNFIHRV